MSALLPKKYEEFNTKEYWDNFFKQRGNNSFEWYGNFKEIQPLLGNFISKDSSILVIGCGNSDFSSDLYDKGFTDITNLDFSELVIYEMKIKNMYRTEMKWEIGDMTNLTDFNDASFDIVIDKGALDALMSTDTIETKNQANKMFSEIHRVLKSSGKYLCITLAEQFILGSLLQFYFQPNLEINYLLDIYPVISSTLSPFLPFFFALSKVPTTAKGIQVNLNSLGHPIDQKEKISQISLPSFIKQIQEFQQLKFKLSKFEIGRFETIHMWSKENEDIPRFTFYIVDSNEQGRLSCAVFFIPFGREADYQFTTLQGLLDISFQADCKRLIAVSCNRPHQFPEMNKLQEELSPIVVMFKQASMNPNEIIPYMAIGQDNNWETIEQGNSPLSGVYIVEELEEEESENDQKIYRRLIFLQNQQFVQTEVRLKLAQSKLSKSQKKRNKKKKNSGKASTSTPATKNDGNNEKEEIWEYDFDYLDEHHRGILASCAIRQQLIVNGSVFNESSEIPVIPNGLLVGLGGGALPMALQKLLPVINLSICELDPVVVDVAKKYFAYLPSETNTQIVVADGIEYIRQLSLNTSTPNLDFIIIDVDSKDPSLGLTAPPKEFIVDDFIHSMYHLLKPGGLLIYNVVARNKDLYSDLLHKLKSHFLVQQKSEEVFYESGRILELKPSSDTVNACIICSKGEKTHDTKPKAKANSDLSKDLKYWRKNIRRWMSNIHLADEYLELVNMIDLIKEIV